MRTLDRLDHKGVVGLFMVLALGITFLSLHAVTLAPVTDGAGKTVSTPQTLTVSSSIGGGSTVPVLIGWGGIRLDEAVVGGGVNQPSNPTPSQVFSGEPATNMELVLIKMKALGYNTVRVDFDPHCTGSQYMSSYSTTNLQRALNIAQHYGFWIIVDYHGYSEPFNSSQASCWLNFWSGVTSQFKNSYSQIVWEPLNEPCYSSSCAGSSTTNDLCSGASACVSTLAHEYQSWIDQARAQGDTHWIVVQNICSYGCSLSNWADGFPTVTDPLGTLSQGGRIFISLHSYMGYSSGSWDNATATSIAQQYYQAVVSGVSTTGWPALNTEGGADPLCTSCAPDQVLTGSSGYTVVSFHFIQSLTDLYDTSAPQRINWIWWPAGSWTNTAGAGIYGALQCNSNPIGWGCILDFHPANTVSGVRPTLTIPSAQMTAPLGKSLNFTVTVADSGATSGAVILTATGLTRNMAFNPTTGLFSFTPDPSQAAQTFNINFTATDTNDSSASTSQMVTIRTESSASQPSGGLFPSGISTTIGLLTIGTLIGVVSSIAMLHVRAGSELASARRRTNPLTRHDSPRRALNAYHSSRRVVVQPHRRRASTD